MRVEFDDGSSVEINIGSPGKIAIVLAARDMENPLKLQANSCEIPIKQFAEMVHSLGVELPKPIKYKENDKVEG